MKRPESEDGVLLVLVVMALVAFATFVILRFVRAH
jgi:hypothetical protein